MSPARRTDRYKPSRLDPSLDPKDRILAQIARHLCQSGSVYHVLVHTPDQFEDLYVILVDDHSVVSFELARGAGLMAPAACEVYSFKEYRHEIGQGKARIKLERAAREARHLIGNAMDGA